MSLKRNTAVVYEPIDSRTLSKKEKFHYLVTLMRKPRLSSDSDSVIITPGTASVSSPTSPGSSSSSSSSSSSASSSPYSGSDFDSDFDSDYNSDCTSISDVDVDSDNEDTDGDNTCPPPRAHAQTAQERLQEELRQLDTFWSFKSMPRAALLAHSNYRPKTTLPAGTTTTDPGVYCGNAASREIPPEVDPPCTSPSPSPSKMPTSVAGARTPSPSDITIWSPKDENELTDTNAFKGHREDIPAPALAPTPASACTNGKRSSMGKQNQQQQLVGFAVLEPRDATVQMSYHSLSSSPLPASPGKLVPDVQVERGNCAAPVFQKRATQLACDKCLLPAEARCFSFNQARWRRERERDKAVVVVPHCGNCKPGKGIVS